MKILIIILAIIGLLKVISLFILCIIKLYNKILSTSFDSIEKTYAINTVNEFNLTPSIKLSFTKELKFFEIIVSFLNIEYYSCYSLLYITDKPSKK